MDNHTAITNGDNSGSVALLYTGEGDNTALVNGDDSEAPAIVGCTITVSGDGASDTCT